MGKNTAKGGAESAVEERRLRPIYELLDINNNKKAVQELDRLLKKQPNFISAKVLKALALLRLGKRSECEGIIATVVSDDVPTPTDENTIQALSICYRELNKPRSICELLEKACKVDKSEDLLTHSFMAHVRIEEFQKQHQIALSLYKLYPKTPYFSWSVMSLFIKAQIEAEDPKSLKLALPLAERMMEKFIEDNKIDSDHEIHLFFLILRSQKKYDKILGLLDKFTERTMGSVTGFFQKLKINCLKETQKLDVLAQYLENLILENPDEWKYYDEYVKLLVTSEAGGNPKRVEAFLQDILNSHSSEAPIQMQKKRPAILACFLALDLMVKQSISTDWDPLPLFKLYVENFGHKPTFFFDISTFVSSLEKRTSKDILLGTMKTPSKSDSDSKPNLRDETQRELNYIFLEQSLLPGDNEISTNPAQALDHFETMVRKYLNALDQKASLDEFLVIGSIKLVDSFWSFAGPNKSNWKGFFQSSDRLKNDCGNNDEAEVDKIGGGLKSPTPVPSSDVSEMTNGMKATNLDDGDDQDKDKDKCPCVSEEDFPVLYCGAVLNCGLFESMHSAPMRILIAKLFIRCGAVGAALESLRGLDLKHIQLESLGYIYIWKLIRCGFMIEGYRILHQIEHFYNTYEKESMEHILSAYKYGSWEKILEFMDFRTILLRSGQFATVKVERRLLEYHRDAGSRADLQRIIETIKREAHLENSFLKNWDVLTDNRDLGVIAETGVKKHPKLVEWGASTFIADKKKLKVRGYLLTLINHCALLIDNSTGEDELKDLQAKIENTHSKLAEEITITGKEFEQEDIQSIAGPWPSRIAEYAQAGYCQLLLKFSSLVISLLKDSGNPESNSVFVESSAKIRQDLEGMVNQRLTAWKKFQSRKNLLDFSEVLENGYDLIETLSFACVFLDVISFVLLKNAANVNQKSRKKKGKVTTMDTSHYSHFLDLLSIVSESLVKIENELRETTHLLIQNVSSKWENLDGFWKGRVDPELYTRIICYSMPTILFKFSESYYNSLQEISANIASKTNYLDTIRAQF